MKKKIYLCVLIMCCSLFSSAQDARYALLLKSGTVHPPQNLSEFIALPNVSPSEIVNGYYYRFIQFNEIPDESAKAEIRNAGIILLQYLPYHTYVAAIPQNINRNIFNNLNIRSVIQNNPLYKVNALLLDRPLPAWAVQEKGKVDIRVQYQRNIAPSDAIMLFVASGYKVISTYDPTRLVTLRVDENKIQDIASLPFVFYMEAIAPPSTPDDTRGRSLHRSNAINTDFATGRHYDGSGVNAALADDGAIGPHIDFKGRLTQYTIPLGGTHGDMTSGILMGAGNLDPTIRGMGTGAHLHLYSISGYTHIIDAPTNLANLGTVITSTSYSQGCNEYTTDTELGDQMIYDNPSLVHVFSAGNNGGGNCGYGAGGGWGNITGGYKQGKNVIATGNLNAFDVLEGSSSRGPASDGRIKPDICANGIDQLSTDEDNTYQVGGGTSAAAPGIAGILTQLYQAYKSMNGGNNPESPLMKACLLNSTRDLGNTGPDFQHGWGRVNALGALGIIEQNHYFSDTISHGGVNTHTITIPGNVEKLRVMIYWADPGGTPLATKSLVNDLNTTITDPSLNIIYPWLLDATPTVAALSSPATTGIDSVNNMEQIIVDQPPGGTFTLTVTGYQVPQGPQKYHVVYTMNTDGITVTYPIGSEGFVAGEDEVIRWSSTGNVGNFTLDYSTDNGTTWNNIAVAIPGNQSYYMWTVPSTVTDQALIRVTGTNGSTDVSDTLFTIINTPTNIQVAFACPDSIGLTWNAVAGASGYEISVLGAMYMDAVGTSTTTSYTVTNINPLVEQWFSVKALGPNGGKGRRALAIKKDPGIFSCVLANDIGVPNVVTPASGTLQDCQGVDSVNVSIKLKNEGFNPATGFDVYYSINGGTPVSETYASTIQPGDSAIHVFSTVVDLSVAGNYTIDTWVNYTGDQNVYNDTSKISIDVIAGTVVTAPVVEDLEGFSLCATTIDCEATICGLINGWINVPNFNGDDIDWRTNEGSTPSANTGPDVDHTTGSATGNYVYLEASGGCNFKTATLISPCMDLTAATQPLFSFWYHMYGTAMGELHVDIYSNGQWINDVMAPISGDQGNQWLQFTVNLSAYVGQVINIRLRGITGNDFSSDLALDDINLAENNSAPLANFMSNQTLTCDNVTVTFTDMSLFAPTSWSWSFIPSTVIYVNGTSSTSQNPQVQFNAPGLYDVTLTATNAFGNNSVTKSAYINIISASAAPLQEDFQTFLFPPINWKIESAGGAFTWDHALGVTGSNGAGTDAAFINNFDYNNPPAEDGLVTEPVDITGIALPGMTFDVSYARYSATFSDGLRIDISTDCGQTWQPTGYLKTGLTLATVPDNTNYFTPTAAGEWRNDTVSLSGFTGGEVMLKFVNINGYGNNLYVDNINLHDITVGINELNNAEGIVAFPNPFPGVFTLYFGNASSHVNIALYDVRGVKVMEKKHVNSSIRAMEIDLSSYSEGVYFLDITGENILKKIKMLKMD